MRKLVKDDPGVIKVRQGRKKVHTTYSVPEIGREENSYAAAKHCLVTTPRESHEFRFRFTFECFLQDFRDACLPFGHPCCVMLPHNLFRVAEQFSHVAYCDVRLLQKYACKSMTEPVRCGPLGPRSAQIPKTPKFAAPYVGNDTDIGCPVTPKNQRSVP